MNDINKIIICTKTTSNGTIMTLRRSGSCFNMTVLFDIASPLLAFASI